METGLQNCKLNKKDSKPLVLDMANEPLEKEAVLAKIKRAWDMPKVFFVH